MESSSRIYVSPSFNRHSSNNIADIADRVVQELLAENGLVGDEVFSFSDDDTPADTGSFHDDEKNNTQNGTVKKKEENYPDEDEQEFEFPVVCSSSPVEVVTDDPISPRYPLFDTSLLSDVDLNSGNGVDTVDRDSNPTPPPPASRPSLMKLFSEDRDSGSCSSSEADDLDGITPGTYCVWKPKEETRGKHKKSNSISIDNHTSKRWKVRDLLKRSYSDDSYTTTDGRDSPVVLFIPPISPNQKTKNEKVKKIEKTSSAIGCGVGCGGGGGLVSGKTDKPIPAYKAKIGNIRIPPNYPYRRDQIAVFANFSGSSKNLYKY